MSIISLTEVLSFTEKPSTPQPNASVIPEQSGDSEADLLIQHLNDASSRGDVDALHVAYLVWMSKRRPDQNTGYIHKGDLWTATSLAAVGGHHNCLAYLLSQGIKYTWHLIRNVVDSKSTKSLQVLLDHGWDINEPESYCEPPALALAVRDQHLVQWFLDHGANPDTTASLWDITPLSYAVEHAPLQTIKHLFSQGGSVKHGQLVNYASNRTDNECLDVLQFLVDRGAPVNNTLWENQPELIDRANCGATTPLSNAVTVNNVEAVRFLLAHGADPLKPNKPTKSTPLSLAQTKGNLQIVELMKENIQAEYQQHIVRAKLA